MYDRLADQVEELLQDADDVLSESTLHDHRARECPFTDCDDLAADAADALSAEEVLARCADLCVELCPRDRAITLAYLSGNPTVAVADLCGVSERTARRVWRASRAWLRRAFSQAYADEAFDVQVRECWGQQVRPRRYRRPRHCPPGREACRATGRCPYRGGPCL